MRGALRRAAIVVASLLAPFLLLEGCSAIVLWTQGPLSRPGWLGGPAVRALDVDDGYSFDPLTIWLNRPGVEGLYAQPGLPLPPRRPGVLRVFVVGGSTVANVRKAPGDRIVDHVARTLGEGGVAAEVLNLGVPAYTSLNELYLVQSTLLALDPDAVVVYDGVNDAFYGAAVRPELWRPNQTDLAIGYAERMQVGSTMRPLERLMFALDGLFYTPSALRALVPARFVASTASLARVSGDAYREALERDTALRVATDPVEYARAMPPSRVFAAEARVNAEAIAAYLGNVDALAAVVPARGAKFLHVLQPTALTKERLHEREAWSLRFNEARYAGFGLAMRETYAAYRSGLAVVARRRAGAKAAFLDLSDATDRDQRWLFDDYCHAYRDGELTSLVGERIGAALLPLLAAEARSGRP